MTIHQKLLGAMLAAQRRRKAQLLGVHPCAGDKQASYEYDNASAVLVGNTLSQAENLLLMACTAHKFPDKPASRKYSSMRHRVYICTVCRTPVCMDCDEQALDTCCPTRSLLVNEVET